MACFATIDWRPSRCAAASGVAMSWDRWSPAMMQMRLPSCSRILPRTTGNSSALIHIANMGRSLPSWLDLVCPYLTRCSRCPSEDTPSQVPTLPLVSPMRLPAKHWLRLCCALHASGQWLALWCASDAPRLLRGRALDEGTQHPIEMLLHRLSGGCRIAGGDRREDLLMLGGGPSRTVGAQKHSLEAFEQWLGPVLPQFGNHHFVRRVFAR